MTLSGFISPEHMLPGRLLTPKKLGCDNVLDCGHWMIPILELS